MLTEISSAADFLVHLLRMQHRVQKLSETQLNLFKGALSNLLSNRYKEHWFPERPYKGSAYRCIRINGNMDPLIIQAGAAMGLSASVIRSLLPSELTMWIDPEEVSYRIGENGSICVLYEKLPNAAYAVLPNGAYAVQTPPPCQSPELYLDPRQFEQVDPMHDFVGIHY